MVDALTLGCIPVLFEPSEDWKLWPLQWKREWKPFSRVLMNGIEVLNGQVDVLRRLKAIPLQQVARMQAILEAKVNTVHYAFDDIPGDGFDVGLSSLAHDLSTRERSTRPHPRTLISTEP